MEVFVKICVIFVFVGLNAFFVAAEFALVASRTTRLQTLADDGDRSARLALRAIANLDDYISGTQLGITLASLALGWIGEATLANLFSHILHDLPPPFATLATHTVAGSVAFACITFLHIVLGELAPKSVSLLHPVTLSRWVVRPLMLFTFAFWPAIWLLNKSANSFLRLFAIRPPSHAEHVHAPEELLLLLSESRDHGLVEEHNVEMIAGVFDLSRTSVRQAMTPRTEMQAVEAGWSLPQVIDLVHRSGYSRLPVYEEDLDHIVGILLVKDLLWIEGQADTFKVHDLMREPYFIPPTMQVDQLMKELRYRNAHLAIVVDEHGGTLGLITLEDLLEEIVGEIFDEFDHTDEVETVRSTPEGHLSIPGDHPIQDLNERYHLKLPMGEYLTVAGLVLSVLEHIPTVGECVDVDGLTFYVTSMDRLRIERLEIVFANSDSDNIPHETAH